MILSSLLMELCKWKEEFIDNSAVEAYRFVLWVDGIFQAQWQGQWENMIAFLLSRDETPAESKAPCAYMNNIILSIQMKSGSLMIIVWSSILLLASMGTKYCDVQEWRLISCSILLLDGNNLVSTTFFRSIVLANRL